jgi:predicted acetyltransferase
MENINKLGIRTFQEQEDVTFSLECILEEFGEECDPCFIWRNGDENVNAWNIIMVGNVRIGYIKLNMHLMKKYNFIHIPCIIIKKEFRGKGYANKLINFIQNSNTQNFKYIELESLKKSKSFWEKLNFKSIKHEVFDNGKEITTMRYNNSKWNK